MNRARLIACVSCAALSLFTPPALAQRSPRYTPLRPTISPYFGFFQYNTTPLPNYQAFVRPREEMILNFERDSARIGQVEREVRLRESSGNGSLLRETEAEVGTQSRSATFLNLQPYYPLQRIVRTRR